MNEQTARAMTLTELAQRLADEHADPVVVHFAKRVIELEKWRYSFELILNSAKGLTSKGVETP